MKKPRHIDANKIRITAFAKFDDNGDVYVLLEDVRKAIAQTPTENVQPLDKEKDV